MIDETQADTHRNSESSHVHSHVEGLEGVSDARLLWAVVLNQILTVGQIVAGLFSGSVALLSDAAHNFNDANALLIAYIARRIAKKNANERYTFGYRRAETIGALVNLTLLAVIGLYLIYEGGKRLIRPEEIIGWVMAVTAALALVVDVATALLLWAMSRGSLNVRAAFIHNMVDALGSVAVLMGAGAIIWFDWTWIDAVITLFIAGYVLWQVFKMLPQAIRLLMEGAPVDFDFNRLVDGVKQIAGVDDIHHVHVWELDEDHRALEAHVIVRQGNAGEMEATKKRIKRLLRDDFQVHHSTLEFEYAGIESGCEDRRVITDH